MTEPSPTREQAEALIETVRSDLRVILANPDDPERRLQHIREHEGSLDSLAAAVSLLVTERDAAVARANEARFEANRTCMEADELLERADAAEAQVADLTRALEAIKQEVGTSTLAAKIAREALAGGGRTPTGTELASETSAEGAVAEALRDALEALCADFASNVAELRERVPHPFWDGRISAFEDAGKDLAGTLAVAAALTTATVSPPEPVSPGAADVAEAGA